MGKSTCLENRSVKALGSSTLPPSAKKGTMLYYPECDGHLFFKNIREQEFNSDAEAVLYYQKKYGTLLMAVVKDNDPEITAVYERTK